METFKTPKTLPPNTDRPNQTLSTTRKNIKRIKSLNVKDDSTSRSCSPISKITKKFNCDIDSDINEENFLTRTFTTPSPLKTNTLTTHINQTPVKSPTIKINLLGKLKAMLAPKSPTKTPQLEKTALTYTKESHNSDQNSESINNISVSNFDNDTPRKDTTRQGRAAQKQNKNKKSINRTKSFFQTSINHFGGSLTTPDTPFSTMPTDAKQMLKCNYCDDNFF